MQQKYQQWVSHSLFFFETVSHYVAQVNIKLTILLSQTPECWGYRCMLPYPATGLLSFFNFYFNFIFVIFHIFS
jgi:hypothetical protein